MGASNFQTAAKALLAPVLSGSTLMCPEIMLELPTDDWFIDIVAK